MKNLRIVSIKRTPCNSFCYVGTDILIRICHLASFFSNTASDEPLKEKQWAAHILVSNSILPVS